MEELNQFYKNNKSLCLALRAWLDRNNKPFNLTTALAVIYTFCNGNKNTMKDVITQFKESLKSKVQGRTQVYNDAQKGIDIIHDPNGSGQLIVVGYAPEREKPLQGQHRVEDPTKTKSGGANKTVVRSLETMEEVGKLVREMYPGEHPDKITLILNAIRNYSLRKKKSQLSIAKALKDGKLRLTSNYQIKGKVNEGKTIFINEDVANKIGKEIEMTEYKFNSNVKRFLHDLLVDPVGADTSFILQLNGLGRDKMLKLLSDNKMIEKVETISDKNEDGSLKTAVMKVKYNVPKKNFEHNLKKLFISLFEKNLGECTAAGAAGGGAGDGGTDGYQYLTPLFGQPIKQKQYNEKDKIDETAAETSVGDIGFDAPPFSDDETRRRQDGIGGSTSMYRKK